LGEFHDALGDPAQAQVAFRAALAVDETLIRDFPAQAAYRHHLAGCHHTLRFLAMRRGD
jgi:hypothetical protein